MTIAIAGSTGLTGNLCVQQMMDDERISRVINIGRRPIFTKNTKLSNVLLIDGKLYAEVQADAFICCLGTTINKAGSQEAFKAVDQDLPLYLAGELNKNGCRNVAVISAMGANAHSRIFYSKVKGAMEEGMKTIGFKSLTILRPSFIDGNRRESRPLERISIAIARLITPLLIAGLRNYRPIKASTIASALVNAVLHPVEGTRVVLSDEINKLGSS